MDNRQLVSHKTLLFEVSIIRPIVIGLLVLMHSFTKISSGGGYVHEYQLIGVYKWFVWLISGFRIETIALIAGYVFAYQSIDLGRKYPFRPFIWKKFKRLIIPMVVFGLAYYFCFLFRKETFTAGAFLIALFSGCGHLWFLPMLFWCFLGIWIIDHLKLSSWITLLFLAAFTMMPLPSLHFGLGRLPHFLFFVYAGYFLWTKREYILNHWLDAKLIAALWILYVLLVVIKHNFIPEMSSSMSMIQKGMIYMMNGGVVLLTSCCGILALYLTVCKKTTQDNYRPDQWVIDASNNCYGVYVYHQFILVFLYFCTPLYDICNTKYLLPWIGFVLSMSISLLLTRLTLKTKFGRFLIG